MGVVIQDNMSDLIKKVTKPYIYESIAALLIDAMLALFVYLFVAIVMHEFIKALIFVIPILLMAIVLDVPLLIKCILDRKFEIVLEVICTIEDIDYDASYSNKITRGEPSLLTTWYYPKKWHMVRYKLELKTKDGKIVKPRSVRSLGHGQGAVLTDIIGIQRSAGNQMLFSVKYCKYSKALLNMRMISYPADIKRRTKDYIDSSLRDLLRWTIKN